MKQLKMTVMISLILSVITGIIILFFMDLVIFCGFHWAIWFHM